MQTSQEATQQREIGLNVLRGGRKHETTEVRKDERGFRELPPWGSDVANNSDFAAIHERLGREVLPQEHIGSSVIHALTQL